MYFPKTSQECYRLDHILRSPGLLQLLITRRWWRSVINIWGQYGLAKQRGYRFAMGRCLVRGSAATPSIRTEDFMVFISPFLILSTSLFITLLPDAVLLLTPRSTVLLEKLTDFQLVKNFPAFYGIRRFITAFTSACHVSLSLARSIQSMPPHPTSWRSILILSSHLRLGLPSGLFPSDFPTNTLYTPLLSPVHATFPARLILLDLITRKIFGEQYR